MKKGETTHTPGPWTVERTISRTLLTDAQDNLIAEIVGIDGEDARLIAAAPDLLAALLRYEACDPDGSDFDGMRAQARAAIAKATR